MITKVNIWNTDVFDNMRAANLRKRFGALRKILMFIPFDDRRKIADDMNEQHRTVYLKRILPLCENGIGYAPITQLGQELNMSRQAVFSLENTIMNNFYTYARKYMKQD